MKLHANAALSLKGRRELCRRVVSGERTLSEAAEAAEVSVRCARKWVGRYRAEGEFGLLDRSSAPRSIPHRTSARRVETIAALRRLRFTGPEIAETLGMALSTVSGILKRIGMGKLGRLGLEPAQRYQRDRPGELIHIDVKKLGRIEGGAGKRFAARVRATATGRHTSEMPRASGVRRSAGSTCTSRSMTAAALPTPKFSATRRPSPSSRSSNDGRVLRTAWDHRRAAPHRQRLGYRSMLHAIACRSLGIKHLRTRAYRPQTNGKAERFIRTLLGGWAYGSIYRTSTERTAALDGWLWHYNHQRRHSALGHHPPILTRATNLLGTYT